MRTSFPLPSCKVDPTITIPDRLNYNYQRKNIIRPESVIATRVLVLVLVVFVVMVVLVVVVVVVVHFIT